MTAIVDIVPRIYALAPEAPDPLITRLIRETARDFFRYSRAWQEAPGQAVDVVDGTHTYGLVPPTDAKLVDILNARYEDEPLIKRSLQQLDRDIPDWRTTPSKPRYILLADAADSITLAPLPDSNSTGGLKLTCVWQPTLTATELPTRYYELYEDAFVDGTASRLFRIPGRPWTDLQMSGFHEARYLAARDTAKTDAEGSRMKSVARKVRYGGL